MNIENKINDLLNKLTLDEKISMIHGNGLFKTASVERLGIPSLHMADGPMGVRNEFENDSWVTIGNNDDFVTYLPCTSALASTWNKDLAYMAGEVLGEETRGRKKDMILAPGINIKRSPLCGRNFEYMSEDPFLTGEMAVPLIKGIQNFDVSACVKHFALNNQETERLWVNVDVSDRALREIYLPAFEKCVKEGKTHSLMGAYNLYKNEHCCESEKLLKDILRNEWGFDGVVVSDWGAVHNTEKVAKSGLDIEMSVTNNFDEYFMAEPLKKAILNGEISEDLIDEKIKNILRVMYKLNMLENSQRKSGTYNSFDNQQKTLEIARESVVLLKNENNILPLKQEKVKKVLVIGDNANRVHSYGGCSAEIKALYEICPLLGIKQLLGGNTEVTFAQGYIANDFEKENSDLNWQATSLENGGGSTKAKEQASESLLNLQEKLRNEALSLAKDFDNIIFIGGQNHLQDLEGHDRPDMKLPYAQDTLIEQLLDINKNTVIVLLSGSPVEMPWINKANNLIWCWYAGMQGGTALAEVIFGKTNPSGKIPETFIINHNDCPAHFIGEFPGGKEVKYKEDIFVGYRYYDKNNTKVLFPFGYGLSYTNFKFDNLKIDNLQDSINIYLDVTNVGNFNGKEVIQVYIGKKDSNITRALKELKAFEKCSLNINESKNITLNIPKKNLAYYDEDKKQFIIEKGKYEIYIGNCIDNILLTGNITV